MPQYTDKVLTIALLVTFFLVTSCRTVNHTSIPYQQITGWSRHSNAQIAHFLQTTDTMKSRKVAVFDCDGTLIGQRPYYLNDEALFSYMAAYRGKTDDFSKQKYALFEKFCSEKETLTDDEYYQYYARMLSGMTREEARQIGIRTYNRCYTSKVFTDMQTLITNLKRHNFEIWVVTGSLELLYQQVCAEAFGIPEDHIIGIRIKEGADGKLMDECERPLSLEAGKVNAIKKYIGVRPLLAAGNSRGDLEMMQYAQSLKIILNPNDTRALDVLGGKTLKKYWQADSNCIVEQALDIDDGYPYFCHTINLPQN